MTTTVTRAPRVKWRQYADGETRTLTLDEVQEVFGNDIRQLRNRLTAHCRRKGWAYTSRVDGDVFRFAISTDGNLLDLGRKTQEKLSAEELQRRKNERKRLRRADEIAELADVERWLTRVETGEEPDEPEPDGMAEIRARQATRRKKAMERLKAQGKVHGWRWREKYRMGQGPTVYQLARYIHVRMKNDRKHKGYYRFTYEWVRSHYPHLLANYRDLVEDSLELLVIQGKIERLDIPVMITVSGGES